NWGNSFGNAGFAAWRPGGAFGFVSGWSSNKVYVFDGAWTMATLPLPTGMGPQGIGWKPDGTRALIVGRALVNYASVVEYRGGWEAGFSSGAFVNQSIPAFNEAPWFGNTSSQYLLAVDWRPNTACDSGLIVGTDNGTSNSPTHGLIVRFHDAADPACV